MQIQPIAAQSGSKKYTTPEFPSAEEHRAGVHTKFRNAVKLREEGENLEALKLFLQIRYGPEFGGPGGTANYNVALCLRKLGEVDKALRTYQELVATAQDEYIEGASVQGIKDLYYGKPPKYSS